MAFARTRAVRGLHTALRSGGKRGIPRASAPARTQLVQRRCAGSDSHHGESGSDVPWMIGAVVATIPSCWYLWPEQHADSGHHDEHGEHEKHEEEHEEKQEGGEEAGEEAPQEDAPQEEASQEEAKSEEPTENDAPPPDAPKQESDATQQESQAKEGEEASDSSSSEGESESAGEDTDQTSASEGEEDSGGQSKPRSGVGKGRLLPDSPGASDTRKREPDSKGAFKRRIDSGLQKQLGAGPDYEVTEQGEKESQATAKTPQKGKPGEMTNKQFGLSNTATRHSTQIDQDPEKSKKGSGEPETAKAMGTVDPFKPSR